MPPGEVHIERHHTCDILVIGAGVSGYCAAIQAGRMGCRTILIEKDAVLGGNAGPDVGVGITGADRYNPYGTETGIIHEIHEEAAWVRGFTQVSRGAMPYNISRRFEAVVQTKLEQAGVLVLKRHYARRPILDSNGRIVRVIVEDLASFQTVRIDIAHVVIEASGDGEIGVLSGADFDVGSEAQNEFGERSAPEKRTNTVQGTSLVAIAQRTDHEIVFIPPPGLPPFAPRVWHSRLSSFIHHHDGWLTDEQDIKFLYVTEAGGSMDTIREDGAIYELLLKQLWAEWDHIKNGPHREAARNWDLLWVSPKAGKRESRRLLGDVMITQTDLESGCRFPDDIAYGGHDLDDHQPLGGTGNIFGHSIPPMYGIPYRACYSRNVPNLLLAGRLISATHLAHSSTRLMRTGGAIGQAVGIAAALCCRHECSPRTIHTDHLEELQQQLMAADGTILNRDLSPADDLAPSASITSSSELRYNDQSPGLRVPLIARAGAVLWDWPPTLEAIELYLETTTGAPQPLDITIYRASREPKWTTVDIYDRHQRDDLRDSAFSQIAQIPVTVPAGHRGWFYIVMPVPLDIGARDPSADDDRLLVAISENQAVRWALAEQATSPAEGRTSGSRSDLVLARMIEHSHHLPEWQPTRTVPTLRLVPSPPLGEAENVINGFHRRFSHGPTNMWISAPGASLPQSLTLTWPTPQTFAEVRLTFDNLTAFRHDNPWESGERVLPYLVKAYRLEVWRNDTWHTWVEEECNIHRCRRHRLPPATTTQLRLQILATHGEGESARVYQIRVLRGETNA